MAARKHPSEKFPAASLQKSITGKSRAAPGNESADGWKLKAEGWKFPLAFGLMLGLAILKFGNPVILDANVSSPDSFSDAWSEAWPPHWACWFLTPVVLAGLCMVTINRPRWPGSSWLWILPVSWFGWQLVAATQTVAARLTALTLLHFAGGIACYFLGAWLLGEKRRFRWMLVGLLVAFVWCLVRATDQKLFEFPQERQALLEGERIGWTNFASEVFAELKTDGTIITTNGVDVANPLLLAKLGKPPRSELDGFKKLLYELRIIPPRAFGTMVYPNALAGVVLLLFPVLIALAVSGTRRFRPLTRIAAVALALFLGFGSLFWTGSKSGWLIAMAMAMVWLLRLNWSARWKWLVLVVVLAAGLVAFSIRFQKYFAAGATSVSARFDYWHAAVQNTREHPLFGSGPGTFQHPYARLKRPESEMARLTHNDYLEQFSDSGIIGGVSYALWIFLLLFTLARRLWRNSTPVFFAVGVGLLGFFLQGLSEFGLYIPALAWSAFALAGALLKLTAEADSPAASDKLQ